MRVNVATKDSRASSAVGPPAFAPRPGPTFTLSCTTVSIFRGVGWIAERPDRLLNFRGESAVVPDCRVGWTGFQAPGTFFLTLTGQLGCWSGCGECLQAPDRGGVNPLKAWRRFYATSALSWAVDVLRLSAMSVYGAKYRPRYR